MRSGACFGRATLVTNPKQARQERNRQGSNGVFKIFNNFLRIFNKSVVGVDRFGCLLAVWLDLPLLLRLILFLLDISKNNEKKFAKYFVD